MENCPNCGENINNEILRHWGKYCLSFPEECFYFEYPYCEVLLDIDPQVTFLIMKNGADNSAS